MKKILFYNWIHHNKAGLGGGIRIYHSNLVKYFSQNLNYTIYNLQSGRDYTLFRKGIHIKKKKSSDKTKSYTIVNSPILSPSHES
ncbi:MAG: hypothetical protein ACYSUK_10430, partial [Planctomycetota bacterium]